MADTPFHYVPSRLFLTRMLAPAGVVFVLGIGAMGILADPEVFLPKPIHSIVGLSGEAPASLEAATRGGITHWRMISYFTTHLPEVCLGDNAVNSFQKQQCSEFWSHYSYGLALSFLPLALAILFMKFATYGLNGTYKRARRKIQSGKPAFSGIVTDPAAAPRDFYSWWFCLQPIGVQLAKGGQIKVYISSDEVIPRPGQTLAIFEPEAVLGQQRHIALLYAPHVAVVAGVKR